VKYANDRRINWASKNLAPKLDLIATVPNEVCMKAAFLFAFFVFAYEAGATLISPKGNPSTS
jgi:hypothetical protein